MGTDRSPAIDRNDARRLLFIKEMMDGMGPFDFHEMASIKASAAGREEPNDDDYLAAIRASIDGMMAPLIDTNEHG